MSQDVLAMLDPTLAETRARRSFRLKVEHLEERVPHQSHGDWLPRTLSEFVQWRDPERGFGAWTSFSVAAPKGPNADLRQRLDRVLERLRGDRSRTRAPTKRRGRTVEHAQAMAEVKALAAQNLELVERVLQLEAECRRTSDALGLVYKREAELVDRLNKVLPFERQLRSIAPR